MKNGIDNIQDKQGKQKDETEILHEINLALFEKVLIVDG
jgi:hypothetical protein